jgi:hypothetical protein
MPATGTEKPRAQGDRCAGLPATRIHLAVPSAHRPHE